MRAIRAALDFADDHDPPERRERGHGLDQPRQVGGVFQVEVVGGPGRRDPAGDRRLAGLPRAHQGDHAIRPQLPANRVLTIGNVRAVSRLV